MDKEFIKTIISTKDGKDERLIKRGDLIDFELVGIFCNAIYSKVQKMFYQYEDVPTNNSKFYGIEIRCPECGKIHIKSVSKTGAINAIKTINWIKDKSETCNNKYYVMNRRKELFCEECLRKQNELDRKKEEENKKQRILKCENITDEFIWQYLDPNRSFKKEVNPREKIESIMDVNCLDCSRVQQVILEMDYLDFLKTPYWDGVRNCKLKRAKYCCQLCSGKGILNVHHKKYENHGREHIKSVADDDLIVLCKDCHEKFHDKLGKEVC